MYIEKRLENILDRIDGKKNCESDAFWLDCYDTARGTSVKEFLEDLEYYVDGYSEWNHMRNPKYMKECEDMGPKEYKRLVREKKNMKNYLREFKKEMKLELSETN